MFANENFKKNLAKIGLIVLVIFIAIPVVLGLYGSFNGPPSEVTAQPVEVISSAPQAEELPAPVFEVAVPELVKVPTYVVTKGDTAWEIAEARCGDPWRWRELKRQDGTELVATKLEIGDVLVLPLDCTNDNKVQKVHKIRVTITSPPIVAETSPPRSTSAASSLDLMEEEPEAQPETKDIDETEEVLDDPNTAQSEDLDSTPVTARQYRQATRELRKLDRLQRFFQKAEDQRFADPLLLCEMMQGLMEDILTGTPDQIWQTDLTVDDVLQTSKEFRKSWWDYEIPEYIYGAEYIKNPKVRAFLTHPLPSNAEYSLR